MWFSTVKEFLEELQHDCGTVWDVPGKTEGHTSGGKPADAQTNAKRTEVVSAVTQRAGDYPAELRTHEKKRG